MVQIGMSAKPPQSKPEISAPPISTGNDFPTKFYLLHLISISNILIYLYCFANYISIFELRISPRGNYKIFRALWPQKNNFNFQLFTAMEDGESIKVFQNKNTLG